MHHASLWKTALAATSLGIGSVFAQIDFKGTITLGSIILGLLMAAIVGFYATRTKVNAALQEDIKIFRERAERFQQESAQKDIDMAVFERAQQEVRHQLKDELAQCKAELQVERAKHDLGSVMEQMSALHHEALKAMHTAQGEAVSSVAEAIMELGTRVESGQNEIRDGQQQTLELLAEIRDSLRRPQP